MRDRAPNEPPTRTQLRVCRNPSSVWHQGRESTILWPVWCRLNDTKPVAASRMERFSRLRSIARGLLVLVLLGSACGGGGSAASTTLPAANEATTDNATPFADSESACQLIPEDQILSITSLTSSSRWVSSDETSCFYGTIGPAGMEIVTITVAIPSDPDPLGLVRQCAVRTWGEESLTQIEDLGDGGFAIAFPSNGVLIQFAHGEAILGIGVMSASRSQNETLDTAAELARIADDVVATGDVALADGREWPPPECES